MPPKNKKNAPPSTHRKGAHKTRSKPHPPPEFQPNHELTSSDESAALMEVKQMLETLTTAQMTMATKVEEQLSQGKASQVASMSAQPGSRAGGNSPAISSQVALMSAQPGTRAGGNSTAAASASIDLDMEQNVWNMVEHRALAINDDETNVEEEGRSLATRGATSTSGKLRSANTVAVHKVIWPHEYVYTPEGQRSAYEPMSSMAFVTGYMTIMDLQSDPIRKLMWAHLKELMQDGECFGWPTVRAYHAVWLQLIEQGRATWDDEITHLNLRRSLVWHRSAPAPSPALPLLAHPMLPP